MKKDDGEYFRGVMVASWTYFFAFGMVGLFVKFLGKTNLEQFIIRYGILLYVLFILFVVAMFFTIYLYKYKKGGKRK